MNLFEYIEELGGDVDIVTYDDVFDSIVTVSVDMDQVNDKDPDYEWYNLFIKMLLVRVEVIDEEHPVIIAWSDLIRRNIKAFREWTMENWYKGNHKDDDDYICEWLKEIHLMIAGYGSENTYERLCRLLNEVPMV